MANPPEQLTTASIGRLVGYSTQQVRDLERLGNIPRAERGANGYRRFGDRHVVALRAYRALAAAIGPVPTRRLMPMLLAGSREQAAASIDDLHADIARERALVREAVRGLESVVADAAAPFDERDTMSIGELAQALGVRTSALRHWEQYGLIGPDRARPSRARRYAAAAITQARIVAALRAGGYPLAPIGRVLAQVRTRGLTADARALLESRLSELTDRSLALLAAAGHLHTLLDR